MLSTSGLNHCLNSFFTSFIFSLFSFNYCNFLCSSREILMESYPTIESEEEDEPNSSSISYFSFSFSVTVYLYGFAV